MNANDKTLAQKMEEIVIKDYLKRNPQVDPDSIIAETIGGKTVLRSIAKTLKETSPNKAPDKSVAQRQQRFLDELEQSVDVRLNSCQQSVNSSKEYINWLMHDRYQAFDEKKGRKIFDAITRLEDQAIQLTEDLLTFKDKFSESINGGIHANHLMIESLVKDYLQAVLEQLKCLRDILKQEMMLGDDFIDCSRDFFSNQIPQNFSKPDPAFIKKLAQAVLIIKSSGIEFPENIEKSPDAKAIDESLNQLQMKLNQRKKQLHELNQLIAHIEVALECILPSISSSQKTTNASSNRMVFSKKKR